MKTFLTLLSLTLFLSACVDTTGLSPQSGKQPRGNPNAAVTLMEFSDFECPACRAAHAIILKPLLQKYGDRVAFVYKQFPLLTIHELALPLAEASECAADQGKFWEFADMAFERQLEMDKTGQKVQRSNIETWARDMSLDPDLFRRCTTSNIKKNAVMAEFDEGRKLGVNGTPTFFVNSVLVKMDTLDVATVEKALDEALAKRLSL